MTWDKKLVHQQTIIHYQLAPQHAKGWRNQTVYIRSTFAADKIRDKYSAIYKENGAEKL